MLICRNVANPFLADGLLLNVPGQGRNALINRIKRIVEKLHAILQNQRHFLHIAQQTKTY